MNLRVLIVDDERIARQRLRRLLEKEEGVEIAGECADGPSTIRSVHDLKPDLMLLDIKMPEMDGFDVVHALGPGAQPAIVFVTAFDKHAVHAFEICALDYLLKPVAASRLTKTLNRVRDYLKSRPQVAAEMAGRPSSQRFAVRSGQTTTFIAPHEIDWIEADGNYAILHVDNRNHLLRRTMSALEATLPPNMFVRVSRSAILHLNRVKEVRSGQADQHFAVLKDGEQVPIKRGIREIESRLRSAR